MAVKNATVGALRVVLGADTAAFEKGLKQAQSRLGTFGKSMARAAAGIATAMAAVGTGVALAMRGVLSEADKLQKMSRSLGIPIEQLSALKHAAELSGVSLEQLGTSMRRFSQSMAEAAEDSLSSAARSFQAIGVSVTDASGNLRSSMDVMQDVADKFAGMRDSAGKTALAIQLFGRQGAEMITMLNAGRSGLQAMMAEARALGIVFDDETGKAAERFNDSLDRLQKAQKGIIVQVTRRMAHVFAALAESWVKTAKDGQTLARVSEYLATLLKGLVSAGTIVTAVFRELGRVLGGTIAALQAAVTGDFAGAASLAKMHWSNAKDAITADMQFISDLWAEKTQEIAETSQRWPDQIDAPIRQSTRAMADEMRAFHQAASAALGEVINSPTETFQAKMAALEQAVRSGTISFAEFGQVVKRVQDENVGHWENLASTVGSTLSTIFSKSKAAGIADAIINTAVGVTQALRSLPPPFSFAQAGLVAAAGAAQISAIKSTSIGSGGGARRPSASGGSVAQQPQAGGGAPTTILLESFNPGAAITGDQLRGLIENINEGVRNGYRLVVRGSDVLKGA